MVSPSIAAIIESEEINRIHCRCVKGYGLLTHHHIPNCSLREPPCENTKYKQMAPSAAFHSLGQFFWLRKKVGVGTGAIHMIKL